MTIKHSELLTVTRATKHEPETILVQYIEAKEFQGVSLESIEGEYGSTEDFKKAVDRFFDVLKRGVSAAEPYMKPRMNPRAKEDSVKTYASLLLSKHDARRLVDSLTAALETSEKS